MAFNLFMPPCIVAVVADLRCQWMIFGPVGET